MVGASLVIAAPASAHIIGSCGSGYKLVESVRNGEAKLDLYVKRGRYCALTRHVGGSYGKKLQTVVELYHAQGPTNAVPIYHGGPGSASDYKPAYDAAYYRFYAGPVYLTPKTPTVAAPRRCIAAKGRVRTSEVFTQAYCLITI